MVVTRRRALRERFDDADHPDAQPPPQTHRCNLYLATDAAVIGSRAGLGALVESPERDVIARWRRPGYTTDNNGAELEALHFGLDRLTDLDDTPHQLGILLDHDALARTLVAAIDPNATTPTRPPANLGSPHHWGGILARVSSIPVVRVGVVESPMNPAHTLANGVAAD